VETANIFIDPDYAYRRREVVPGHYVQLTIRDSGLGMSAEVQARIFEPFFTTKEAGQGTGLGLATCFGIVKQSGGYITVDSQLERGTTFTVYLPTVEAVPQEIAPAAEATDLPTGSGAILLVEDEVMVRDLAVNVLRQQGYTVLAASNGEEGLRLTTSNVVLDLLVTDVVMPRLSGKELADQLAFTYPDLKVLYISGYSNSIFPSLQQLPPGIAFLQKPFSPAAFLHKVREILES
jgi:CheY-like chemotaxis protein